ncbi:type I secretion system permease/ATPase [Novosphingobium sp.]|uniref:type I secretion system permease/ATPase n=1 Tax=Novosphingobium sp. TaxID=1874826 RepID=UPI002B46B844|nr:type I secretion system permease/ATPase [Novosphingobium sp.]HKR91671.1 type I secretion system permease/ATPase [Novosphingobium sp.]
MRAMLQAEAVPLDLIGGPHAPRDRFHRLVMSPSVSVLSQAIAECRRHIRFAAGFSALVNLLYIVPTLYMLQVYERVVPTGGLQTLAFLTLVLLFGLSTLSLLDRIRSRLLVRGSVRLDCLLSPAVLEAAIARPRSAEARQALRDFDTVRNALSGPAALAVLDIPWLPIYLIVCFIMHPAIGAMALFGGIALPFIAWLNERTVRSGLSEVRNAAFRSQQEQNAAIDGAEVLRALGMQRNFVARALKRRDAMLTMQASTGFLNGDFVTATKFLRLTLQSLALGAGAWLAVERQISPGAIFASSFLIARALSPVEQVIGNWKTVADARKAWRDLGRLFDDLPSDASRTALPAPQGHVELEAVSVLDPAHSRVIVQNVSLSVGPGQILAIMGPSGAGKSTLARCVANALLPDRGSIRFDGSNIRDWDAETLGRHIGYLPQTPTLFEGTIAENIARFAGETDSDQAKLDEMVIAAARRVFAHELILQLPGGYQYGIAQGGLGLSAGQSQRIALARAVFGAPTVLVLDEPNAHLDTEGDQRLMELLAGLKRQRRTVIIVTHKLTVMPVVDRIAVMKEGQLAMLGSRDEVLAKIARPLPATLPPVPERQEAGS